MDCSSRRHSRRLWLPVSKPHVAVIIPFYQTRNLSRIAHAAELHYPERLPIMGDWPGWQPDVWWWEERPAQ